MVSHIWNSVSDPVQFIPPLAGLGLAHDLNLVISPFPQETLQADHIDHNDQCPSTEISKRFPVTTTVAYSKINIISTWM